MGWNCDGRRLASGSFDKSVAIFLLDRDRLVRIDGQTEFKLITILFNLSIFKSKAKDNTYKGHTGSVDQLCWHATQPDLLSTASGDKTVRIWDVRAGKCSTTINTKGENINITWSPDGHTIAVGNKEDLVTFIDTRTLKVRAEEQFNFEVNEIAWNNTSDLFFLTNGQGCIHVLSYPDLELQHMLKAHPGTCICIEFDPTGKYFATGSADALVSLWDAEELACLVRK